MKLSCTRENLYQGLALTAHASTKNTNLPILNNVLLRADIAGLKMTATNLETTITCNVRGKVDQPGEYTVPSRLFTDFVSLLPNERIDMDLLDASLLVVCEKTKTKMNGIPSVDFPLEPPVEGGAIFSVPVRFFDEALAKTLFAVSTSEGRQSLTGVYLQFDGNAKMLTLAATDSFRLSEAAVALASQAEGERKVIVPARALSELRRIFSVLRDSAEAPENVEIEISDRNIVFRYGAVELSTRTIDASYPDYRQIIPKSATTTVVVDKNGFAQAIKRASLFARSGIFDVRIEVKPETNEIILHTNDVERGENTISLDAKIDGPANDVSLNYRYLLDGINAIVAESATLKIIDRAGAVVLTPSAREDEKFLYIVMPIRQ